MAPKPVIKQQDLTGIPLTMGETAQYADAITSWAARYSDGADDRLTTMLGKLTLLMLRRRKDGGALNCQPDPRGTGNHVLHFEIDELDGVSHYCLTVESSVRDLVSPLCFDLRVSNGAKPDVTLAAFDSTMSFRDMWARVP